MTKTQQSDGRTLGMALIGTALVAVGLFAARRLAAGAATGAEHRAPDLALGTSRNGPQDRAPDAFRPDPTAPVPAAEREPLRPATIPIAPVVAARR